VKIVTVARFLSRLTKLLSCCAGRFPFPGDICYLWILCLFTCPVSVLPPPSALLAKSLFVTHSFLPLFTVSFVPISELPICLICTPATLCKAGEQLVSYFNFYVSFMALKHPADSHPSNCIVSFIPAVGGPLLVY